MFIQDDGFYLECNAIVFYKRQVSYITMDRARLFHRQKSLPPAGLVRQMACLNDRYALDGLSAPSYTGLLWCLGWCDKLLTGGRISTKPASGYRVGREGFQEATVSFRETSNMNQPPDTKTSRDASESREQPYHEKAGTSAKPQKRRKTIDTHVASAMRKTKN
jgi:hypothetical protein